jgi:hypothetical protein
VQSPTFGWQIAKVLSKKGQEPMPQEISVSYQAIKSKVYRLVDALVVGEKTEAEVQESISRWWNLIHPADRPIAQKYLLAVLARSTFALEAIEDSLNCTTDFSAVAPDESGRRNRLQQLIKRTIVKRASLGTAV